MIIPNNTVGREAITNYSEPTAPTRQHVEVGATYAAAPNDVRDALTVAMGRVPRVLKTPPPDVVMSDFGGSAIVYRARFWLVEFELDENIRHDVRSAIYYEFNRRGIEIPWPIQIQYDRQEQCGPAVRRQVLAEAMAKVPCLPRCRRRASGAGGLRERAAVRRRRSDRPRRRGRRLDVHRQARPRRDHGRS